MKNLSLKAISNAFTRKIGFVSILIFSAILNLKAQCPVTAHVNPTTVLCGSTVSLTAVAAGCQPLRNNFNGGDMTMGGTQPWASTNGATVQNGTGAHSCVGPPSEGAFSVWMGTTVAAPRSITSNAYDMTICSAVSGTICFDMKYGTQAGASPCEGIDLPAEGVSIQYNTGGGWVTLQYWDPNGGYDANLTAWRTYCITLPPAALTPATAFRWYQSESSGAGFDAWGLDNIVINLNAPGYTFDWAHDAQAPSGSPATPNVVVTANTTYTVTYTNGVETCSDNVSVAVISPTATATVTPSTFCAGSATPVQLNAISSISYVAPTSCSVNADAVCPQFATIADERTIGTGTHNYGYNTGYAPGNVFGGFGDAYNTTHIIYRASELTAAGMVAGQITNLSFDIQRIEDNGSMLGSVNYNEIKIDMGCTSATTITNFATPAVSFSTVFDPASVTFTTASRKTFFFNRSYNWDGVSNLVVRVCWRTSSGGSSTGVYAFTTNTNLGYNCLFQSGSNFEAGQCSTAGSTSSGASQTQIRPNTTFGYCKPSNLPLTYSWTSSPAGLNSTIRNPTHAPASNTSYTVAVNQLGMPAACAALSTVNVSVIAGPTVTINPNPVEICAAQGETSEGLSAVAVAPSSVTAPKTYTSTAGGAVPEGAGSCGGSGTLNSPLTVGGASPLTLAANPIQSVVISMNPVANISDFEFILIAPTGTTYLLVDNKGGANAGPQTFTLVTGAAALPTTTLHGGTYAPGVAFPTSGNVNGVWTLRVIDRCKPAILGSVGTLVSWSIKFNAPTDIVSYSWSPATNLSTTTEAYTTTTTASNRTYTVTATDVNGCTGSASVNVTIGCVLPVELTDFNLTCENNRIDLKWDIASQQDNDFFTLERSFDGITYSEIGQIDGDGNSSLMTSYNFIDKNEVKNVSNVYPIYYRLSQTDYNGHKEIIALKAIQNCKSSENICVNTYPNPVDNYRVTVSTSGIKNKSFDFLLHDMLGKLVYSKTITPESDEYILAIDLPESLQKGIYLISSKGANEIQFCEQKIAIQ